MNYKISEVVRNHNAKQYPKVYISNGNGSVLFSGLMKDTPKEILDKTFHSSSFNNQTMYISVKEEGK